MGLEVALATLTARSHALVDALTGLHTTVVSDRPLEGDAVLVDLFGNSAEDLIGWVVGAQAAIRDAQQALFAGNLDGARWALAAVHEQAGRAAVLLLGDLLRYERIAELLRFGRARGGEWRAWAYSVKQALDSCLQPLFDLDQALAVCWQELASIGAARGTVALAGVTPHTLDTLQRGELRV